MKGQYLGHVICLDQSEASIQVIWSVLTNHSQVPQVPCRPVCRSRSGPSVWSDPGTWRCQSHRSWAADPRSGRCWQASSLGGGCSGHECSEVLSSGIFRGIEKLAQSQNLRFNVLVFRVMNLRECWFWRSKSERLNLERNWKQRMRYSRCFPDTLVSPYPKNSCLKSSARTSSWHDPLANVVFASGWSQPGRLHHRTPSLSGTCRARRSHPRNPQHCHCDNSSQQGF